jgi:hypothetical protein
LPRCPFHALVHVIAVQAFEQFRKGNVVIDGHQETLAFETPAKARISATSFLLVRRVLTLEHDFALSALGTASYMQLKTRNSVDFATALTGR